MTMEEVRQKEGTEGLVNVEGTVSFGKDPLETRRCNDGSVAYIKTDGYIEDSHGGIRFKAWETSFKGLTNGARYRLTNLSIYDHHKSGRELSTTRSTQFTELENDLDSEALEGPQMLRTISNVREYEIQQFIACRKFEIYYVCNSCSKPISVSTGN